MPEENIFIRVAGDGRLGLPPEVARRYGIMPGMILPVKEAASGLFINRPAKLAKLYIEPTNRCNLDCRTCIRHGWNEPTGTMSGEVFTRIVAGLRAFAPVPSIFFGGFGEPLAHPEIARMVSDVKALGAKAELITNGTLLSRKLCEELMQAGLDVLWLSLDGATPASYADIRLGATLPAVIRNLESFRDLVYAHGSESDCGWISSYRTQLGIAFVAMKRNIADLPAVIDLGRHFGAYLFKVTNVLPYTPEMRAEILYHLTLSNYGQLCLPKMDFNPITAAPLAGAIGRGLNIAWPGGDTARAADRCPFIEDGAAAIRWDGSFSPCLPLLHHHMSYVFDRERFSRHWTAGNILEHSLSDLWNEPQHLAFRERVQDFVFAPCSICGGCDMGEKNEEDCFGNVFPTCGGCLWAQGLIQCP